MLDLMFVSLVFGDVTFEKETGREIWFIAEWKPTKIKLTEDAC